MAWCLTKQFAEQFKQELIDGKITPEKLNEMSSKERNKFFADKFGEQNAVNINSLFESKLLLKNQQRAMVTWAEKTLSGVKGANRDIVSMVGRMDKVLDFKTDKQFLEELASKKLGVSLTSVEAKQILDLSNKIKDLKDFKTTKERIEYGRTKIALTDYINSLNTKKANLAVNIAGVPRSLMASLDLSAPFNQGFGMISRKQFYTAFKDMFKYAKNESNLKDLQADIITRPTYDLAKKGGLRLTELGNKLEMREEQFMSSLLDKVPGISASQRAYTGFLNKLRMDVFDDLVKKAEVAGEDVSIGSKAVEDIANTVNNFTGGARVGKVEGAVPALNAIFFSPRKIMSTLQMINPANYVSSKISKTARIAAARNLIGSLAMSATVISLAGALTGQEQETDPNSSKFGKIKIGDTTLDVSGGNATYLTLLSRLLTQKIKGASGISTPLGTKYGQTSGAKLIGQALRYKLSPNASLLVDTVTGANAIGEKKTMSQSIIDRFKPMFANSVYELMKSDTEGKLALALGALFGGGLNTYKNEVNWSESEGKELQQFKTKVGETKFQQANDLFNQQYDTWLSGIKNNPTYESLSDEDKQRTITKKKDEIKQKIFKQYGFTYKPVKLKKLPNL